MPKQIESMKPMPTKFSIKTLGCKVNQFESDAIARELSRAEWVQVEKSEIADLCIINTCTVTGKASMQSRQAVRQAIRANPQAEIVVTGCYAQTAPDELRKIPGVHAVVGQAEKSQIPGLIINNGGCRDCGIDTPVRPVRRKSIEPAIGHGRRSRPFLKIQDGCDAFCTYCIVPYARGSSRSLAAEDAIRGIRRLKAAGYHEVVLTGIHLGCYGLDLTPQCDLLTLLKKIRDSRAIDRVRLSSIEPHELPPELIEFIADSSSGQGRICPHFHIPLQSGDDGILKKMRRPYTRQYFKELVLAICEQIAGVAIGVDVLVGFPGESTAAFERTYELIAELPVAYLHVFPFSARRGTPAHRFSDPVPRQTIRDRARRMRELGKAKKYDYYHKFVGKTVELVVEKKSDTVSGYSKGTSSNYIPILVKGTCTAVNTLVKVQIKQIDSHLNVFGGVNGNCKK
jgi:threonylcarbamoyladenosine tRNA methylthiotransferase MtaB